MIFFSSNLTACRKGKGWSRCKAAFKITVAANEEVTFGRYQSWELGRCEPNSYQMLVIIAEVMEIDDLYLFLTKDLSEKYIHEQPSLFTNVEG